ncbi:MAG: hypothetical protein IJ325_03050 [Clostridia bacterium]|nr:hypothetical protein [Clostridia bacterium]
MKKITIMLFAALLFSCFMLVGCEPAESVPPEETAAQTESESETEAVTETEPETEPIVIGDINLAELYPVSQTESVVEVTYQETSYAKRKVPVPYLDIVSTESNLAYGYYNKNYFVGSNIFVVCKLSGYKLLAADLTEKVVYDLGISCSHFSSYLVHDELIYYVGSDNHTLSVFDLRTGVNEVVYVFDHLIDGFIETTLDGRYISMTTYASPDADGKYRATIFDMEKREIIDIFDYIFEEEDPVANHHMLNPVDHTQLFFAHDKSIHRNLDRMWLYEIGKEPYCIVDQETTVDENGNTIVLDQLTHECWSYDGKGLWFVNYPLPEDAPYGICYIDLTSSDRTVQEKFTSYPYWHTSCSPDGKSVTGDTVWGNKNVILINLETGEEKPVVQNIQIASGGLDPHPGFSRNSEMLMFEHLNKDTNLCAIGIIRIADVEWAEE